MEKLKVILTGAAGFWGTGWVKVLSESPDVSIAGLVDTDVANLKAVASRVGVDSKLQFSDFGRALESTEADAVIVVVPPDQHYEAAVASLRAGMHCIIEKPFAPLLSQAEEITDLAEELGRTVMISQTFRFRRGARTVQRLIEEGAIGKIGSIHGRLFKAMPNFGPDNFRTLMPEPLIVDQTIHHFDFIRGIFGLEPTRVRALSYNPPWSWFHGRANALVDFQTSDGTFISYSGSWVSRGGPEVNTTIDGSWDIQGEGGAIQWNHNYVRLVPTDFSDVVYRKGTLEREGQVLEVPLVELAQEERAGVLAEFVEAISQARKPEADARDNLKTLALVLKAVESASLDGKWLELA